MCKLDQTQNYNMIWATYSCTIGFCVHAATTGPSGTTEPSAAAGRGLRVCTHVPRSGWARAGERLRPAACGATATAVHPHVRMGTGGTVPVL